MSIVLPAVAAISVLIGATALRAISTTGDRRALTLTAGTEWRARRWWSTPAPRWHRRLSSTRVATQLRSYRVRRRLPGAVPDFLEDIARAVRSGATMRMAVASAATGSHPALADDAALVVGRLDRGMTLEEALAQWARERHEIHAVRVVAAALPLAADAGGAMARVVDGIADTIRSELDIQAEVRSLAAQARASAALIAALPVAFGALAGLLDPQTLAFLLEPGLGLGCLIAGLALDLVGFWWMHRISRAVA